MWLVFVIGVANLLAGFLLAMALEPGYVPRVRRPLPPPEPSRPVPTPPHPDPAATDTEPEAGEDLPARWLELLEREGIVAQSFVEATTHVLRLDVGHYRELLIGLEQRLRRWQAGTQSEPLNAVTAALRAANETWLGRQDEALQALVARRESLAAYRSAGREMEELLQVQQEAIQRCCRELEDAQVAGDPVAECRLALQAAQRLIDQAHALRDQTMEALAEIMRREQRLDAVDAVLKVDPLTGLENRVSADCIFDQWLREDVMHARTLSLALLDVDALRTINQTWGTRIGDAVLAVVGKVLHDAVTAANGRQFPLRVAGQRFLIVCGDFGPHQALGVVERIRQIMSSSTFETRGESFPVTLRAAVTEVQPADELSSVLNQLRLGLQQAHARGGDCVAFMEGPTASFLVPPHCTNTGQIWQLEG